MNGITIGDIIGYLLTFVVGVLSGVVGQRVLNKKTIKQIHNTVIDGDITGGDKIVRKG